MNKIRFLLVSAFVFFPPVWAHAEIALQPHKVLYDVDLKSVQSSSQMTNISGQMYYELAPECDGWAAEQRFSIRYDFSNRSPMKMDSSFVSWEADDGAQFSFSSLQEQNSLAKKEVRGSAERPNRYAIGEVSYTKPYEGKIVLDSDVQFPVAHTLTILQKAAAGEKNIHAFVFDGGDNLGTREVNSFVIGPASLAPEMITDKIDKALLTRAWKIRMAFFPLKEKKPDPEYEMTVLFHDNGIVSHMTVEYPEFSIEYRLSALEAAPPRACE